jgi:hypothetical protein
MAFDARNTCRNPFRLAPCENATYSGSTACGAHLSLYASWVAAGYTAAPRAESWPVSQRNHRPA